jgi:hypothetical protein
MGAGREESQAQDLVESSFCFPHPEFWRQKTGTDLNGHTKREDGALGLKEGVKQGRSEGWVRMGRREEEIGAFWI